MAKVLNQKYLDTVKPADKRQEIPDGGLQGLYLIVQPSGKMSWAARYRHGGKVLKYTIGPYPAHGLKGARFEAGKVLRAASEGRNPQDEKKWARAEEQTGVNLTENVLDDFLKRHVRAKNRASTAGDVEGYIEREIKPKWKGRQVQAIKRRDIVDLLDSVVDRGAPTAANRLHSTLRKFFNWCRERGVLETSPLGNVKAPAAENARDRVLSDTEVRWLWQATDEVGWPFGPLVRLLLLSGQRREEVAGARWTEFDLDGEEPTWIIPAERAKNGSVQALVLPSAARAILRALPRIDGSADLVFTTTGTTTISGFSRAKARLDEAMLAIGRREAEERDDDPDRVKIAPWVVHDLRRTFASGAAKLGVAPHVIEAVLNHKSGTIRGVSAVYNRHDHAKEKRAALTRWARHIEAITGAKPPSNLIQFKGPRTQK